MLSDVCVSPRFFRHPLTSIALHALSAAQSFAHVMRPMTPRGLEVVAAPPRQHPSNLYVKPGTAGSGCSWNVAFEPSQCTPSRLPWSVSTSYWVLALLHLLNAVDHVV